MISIYEVHSVSGAIAFVVWALAAYGLGKAVYRSFWWHEAYARLTAPARSRVERLKIVQWELRHRVRYSAELAAGDDMAKRDPLSARELARREEELWAARNPTFWFRLLRFLGDCQFCHTCQAAIVLWCCTRPVSWAMIPTSLAVAGLQAMWFASRTPRPAPAQSRSRSGGCAGGDCG